MLHNNKVPRTAKTMCQKLAKSAYDVMQIYHSLEMEPKSCQTLICHN